MHLFLSVPKYQWKSDSKTVHLHLSSSFTVGKNAPLTDPCSILKLIQAFEERRRTLAFKQMQYLK